LSADRLRVHSHESAVALYRQHEYAKAAELFERAVATEEKDSPVYRESAVFLGQSYYLSGKIRKAIPWLERAEQSGVNAVEVSYMLGNAYIQTKYAQNKCAGIQDGTIFCINLAPRKCSVANTASGTAMKTQPKVMSLSQPRAARIVKQVGLEL
jgi:tetratricopeptide (TPR) repeat protein